MVGVYDVCDVCFCVLCMCEVCVCVCVYVLEKASLALDRLAPGGQGVP